MWVDRHGDAWRVRDRVGGRILTLSPPGGYPTRTMAETARTLLRADELRGDSLVPRGGRITLDEVIDAWWPAYRRGLKGTAEHSEGGRVRNHIRPLLGPYALEDITTLTVNQWLDGLEAGRGPWPSSRGARTPLAPKTVHNCHGLLFVIFKFAIAERLIRSNPCAGSTLPARVHREMRFLTDPEIERLILATPEHWRPLVFLLIATGLRWGEAIGLKVGRVDLLARKPFVRVVEQLQEASGAGSALTFTSPKSARSRRTVTVNREIAYALAPLVAGKADDEVVFTTPTGLMVRTRNFRRVWLRACARAGLDGLRVHDLRHTHAAILLSRGETLEKISRRLGHASIAVTDAIYGHLRPEADEGILAAIGETIRSIGWSALSAEVDDELADELSDR